KRIQAAVGVLLQHVEVRQVVLEPVAAERAEQARARLLIREDEAPEVARESLNSHPDRCEIEISATLIICIPLSPERRRAVSEKALFEKHLLDAGMVIGAANALADVHVDD